MVAPSFKRIHWSFIVIPTSNFKECIGSLNKCENGIDENNHLDISPSMRCSSFSS